MTSFSNNDITTLVPDLINLSFLEHLYRVWTLELRQDDEQYVHQMTLQRSRPDSISFPLVELSLKEFLNILFYHAFFVY